jgi:hypothetical protein
MSTEGTISGVLGNMSPGIYVFTVTVTDATGAKASNRFELTVRTGAAPEPATDESDIEDITTPSIISAIREGKIPPPSVRPEAGPLIRPEQRPEIIGSARFKEIVNEALDLLYERDREDYYLVCYYLPKVQEAPGSFTVIVNGQAQTFFFNLPQDYPEEDALYYTLGALVHEATHTWLAEKGYQTTGEAGEYFATAVHTRSLLRVGAPSRMVQDPDEAIKSRWWEQPGQNQPGVPGLEPPAGLHVTSIVPDSESPNTYRVTLSWSPVSGASGYKVYTKALWLPDAGHVVHETQSNSYTTSFYVGYPGAGAIGHPEGRASWEIYVTAVNPAGESAPSNVITLDLPPVASGTGAPATQPGVVVLPPLRYSGGLETIRNTYTWDYEGKQFSWTIEVPQVLVRYEQHQKIVKWPLWFFLAAANPSMTFASLFATGSPGTMAHELLANMLVQNKASSEYIGYVAERLNLAAQGQGYDAFHKAEFIAAFVQSIPYKIYLPTNTAYPPEVMAHGGDCINKSVLLAAILDKLGYRVAVFVYPFPVMHAAAGVGFSLEEIPSDRLDAHSGLYGYTYEGVTYYFVETTEPGWRIGELSVETSIRPGIIPL